MALAKPFQRRLEAEGDHHFMVAQPLAALHEPEVPDQAVASAAHAREPAVFESEHGASMHCRAIPSILDTNRFRFVRAGTNRGQAFPIGAFLKKSKTFSHDIAKFSHRYSGNRIRAI